MGVGTSAKVPTCGRGCENEHLDRPHKAGYAPQGASPREGERGGNRSRRTYQNNGRTADVYAKRMDDGKRSADAIELKLSSVFHTQTLPHYSAYVSISSFVCVVLFVWLCARFHYRGTTARLSAQRVPKRYARYGLAHSFGFSMFFQLFSFPASQVGPIEKLKNPIWSPNVKHSTASCT